MRASTFCCCFCSLKFHNLYLVSTATILLSFREFFPSFGQINLLGTSGVYEQGAGAEWGQSVQVAQEADGARGAKNQHIPLSNLCTEPALHLTFSSQLHAQLPTWNRHQFKKKKKKKDSPKVQGKRKTPCKIELFKKKANYKHMHMDGACNLMACPCLTDRCCISVIAGTLLVAILRGHPADQMSAFTCVSNRSCWRKRFHVQPFQPAHLRVLGGVQDIYFALGHVCLSLCSGTANSYREVSLAI